jgi:ABC-2 type transport system ATP-binding protein
MIQAAMPVAASGGGGEGAVSEGATDAAIRVRGLVKRYDGRAVVDRLDLDVAPGELFALLGPNGAGKTTTVEILEGYRPADEGEVRVLGLDPRRHAAALKARIGLMLQGGGIYPQARPGEILRLFARFYADPRDPDELLDLVGLRDVASTRYRVLSGGQRQRLGLALALVGRPELLVLDEPTAGLDPAAKAATRALIADLRSQGTTVLLTTHELADVERLADRVAIIDRGRLVALGTPAELTAGGRPSIRFRVADRLDDADRASLAGMLGTGAGIVAGEVGGTEAGTVAGTVAVVHGERTGAHRIVGIAPGPAAIARLAAWCEARGLLLLEVRTEGGTLEERYLELTGETGADGAAR